jgi:hypothetical protein
VRGATAARERLAGEGSLTYSLVDELGSDTWLAGISEARGEVAEVARDGHHRSLVDQTVREESIDEELGLTSRSSR